MTNLKPFDYLSGLQGMGIHMDLGIIRQVLGKMNHPQHAYPSVLVGGTNGKGSICAMTSSILISAGLKVGLYTSPHLLDVRERIRLNGEMISWEEMADCIETVKNFADAALTYFEFLTAVAFLYFSRSKVDIAVLEVGMGGRLDATNVVNPLVSAISNISLEHCDYLGTRLSQIATEKAGIIKAYGDCVTAATQRSVLDVLEQTCRERKAKLYRIGYDFRVYTHPGGSSLFSYVGSDRGYSHITCPLLGRHQIRNAAVALGITEVLSMKGFVVDEHAVRSGLGGTRWAGRLEVVQGAPSVVLDGAHNPAGISALCEALRDRFTYRRLFMIFGVLRDKDFRGMIKQITAMADVVILTRAASDRALPPELMAGMAERYGSHVLVKDDPCDALQMALTMADSGDLVCVTGSLYLIAQIKSSWGHLAS